MSRYIDAEPLKADIRKAFPSLQARTEINIVVNSQPTIDIVRCKECRFGQWHEQAEEYICIAHDQDLFDAEHFCSYGERREP